MKKIELKNLIREEIRNVLKEANSTTLKDIDFKKLKKIMINASDLDLTHEEDIDDTIKILINMSKELPKGQGSFSKWSSKQDFSGMGLDGDAEDLHKNPKLAKAASDLEGPLSRFDGIQSEGNDFNEYVTTYNEIADIVAKFK